MAKTKKTITKEKEMEKKIERKIENFFEKMSKKCCDNSKKVKGSGKKEPGKVFGEVVGYIIAIVFLYILIPKLRFVTSDYQTYLPIAFWATTVGTFLKVMKHSVPSFSQKSFFEMGDNLASLYSTIRLVGIFPINFALVGHYEFNLYLRYALYLAAALLSLSAFSNFVKIFATKK